MPRGTGRGWAAEVARAIRAVLVAGALLGLAASSVPAQQKESSQGRAPEPAPSQLPFKAIKVSEDDVSPFAPLLDRLWAEPTLKQPELEPDTPVVEIRLLFSESGEVIPTVVGTGLKVEESASLLGTAMKEELGHADLWILTASDRTRAFRAVGIEDPREVIAEQPIEPGSGALTGEIVTVREALIAVYLPFFPRGAYGVFSHDPGESFTARTLAFGRFGDTPPSSKSRPLQDEP